MGAKDLKSRLRRLLASAGWGVYRLSPEDRHYWTTSYDDSVPLPAGAAEALRPDHPHLIELRERYAELALPVGMHSIWDAANVGEDLSLPWFRGDNPYVWQLRQLRSQARLKVYLMLRYVEECDHLGLLQRLDEDGLFGCWRFVYGQRPAVSRDLLDSVNEINFLERHLGLSNIEELRVLDIGAGYGRLAYRMSQSLENLKAYDCVDAIPESTWLCDYYLRFREVSDKARAVPLDQLENLSAAGSYHLAVNIHSFSECTHAAICWWLDRVAALKVPWLLIVPNDPEALLSMETDGSKRDFSADLEAAGYQLRVKEAVYDNEEMQSLIGVRDHYFLYERVDD